MNFILKAFILTAFIGFGTIICQDEELKLPEAPKMEIPAISPEEELKTSEESKTSEQEESKTSEEELKTTKEVTENGTNIGLSVETRQKISTLLNKLLSDEYVLYTKTLKFHWNVTGIVFHDFHEAFKEQYEMLFKFVDDIAERVRALNAPSLGSLQEFSTYTRLKEMTTEKLSALDMIKELLADHEAIIRTLRTDIDETAKLGDQGTSNFLQDLIVKHEKIAWMLRATAQ